MSEQTTATNGHGNDNEVDSVQKARIERMLQRWSGVRTAPRPVSEREEEITCRAEREGVSRLENRDSVVGDRIVIGKQKRLKKCPNDDGE